MERRVQYWAWYKVYSHSIVQEIQDRLRPLLNESYEEIAESEYHITVHPQVQFPESRTEAMESYVRDSFPGSIQATATKVYFHPSRSNPRVISLDIESDIRFEYLQDEFCQRVKNDKSSSETIVEPVNPHITLFSVDKSSRSMTIPSEMDKVDEVCEEFTNDRLPVTFKQTELKFTEIHP